jgi:hypothetical protein
MGRELDAGGHGRGVGDDGLGSGRGCPGLLMSGSAGGDGRPFASGMSHEAIEAATDRDDARAAELDRDSTLEPQLAAVDDDGQ